MKLSNSELYNIYGGSLSATMLNAFTKAISILIDLGKGLGSTIRRVSENKPCNVEK